MTSPVHPLRVAFVGGGSMARAHARAVRRLSSPVTIVGVFDADDSAAEDFAVSFGTASFTSIDALLANARPDIVHICTTAGAHFDAARRAIDAGAHVYVEKPFVETLPEAETLIALAASRQRLICAGHQLLADPVYDALRRRARSLAPFARVESVLSFASPTVRHDSAPRARTAQLLDVLPHPLYTLIAALEWMAPGARLSLSACAATADSLEALFRAGPVEGRLYLSLVTRPVASTLSMSGNGGTLTADFIRGCVTGVANAGTSPIEKILNPPLEGIGIAARSIAGVARRIVLQGEYPGLAILIERFYTAVRSGGASPTPPEHLQRVVTLYEEIVANVRHATASPRVISVTDRRAPAGAPVVAVTGASGFLGRAVASALAERGYRVRGVGRGADPQHPDIHEWVQTDLSRIVPSEAFASVHTVVHAAAATSGGFGAHQRHSVESASRVVDAAAAAGVPRIVHISSLSFVRSRRGYRELLTEATPMPTEPRTLGPYAWGKCASETLLVDRARAAGIAVRVIRPAALTDRRSPELPGLAGRRLFGTWYLFLGRPSHAFATCDVELAGEAIAWYVDSFDEAPPVVNLLDPTVDTRAALIRHLRSDGWQGRGVWVPISWLSAAMKGVQFALCVIRRHKTSGPDVWQVLRPRRFDSAVSAQVFSAMRKAGRRARALTPSDLAQVAASDRAYA